MAEDRSYRIRTQIGDGGSVIHVKLDQTYNMLDILSLSIDQTNAYKLYQSDYGIIVGRVVANGGLGIPNAKVSVFIETEETINDPKGILYPYHSVRDTGIDGIRYNLLPDFVDSACHQNVGTFPDKRFVLDNEDVIEVFDKYYKYTTTTNNAGDYMIFGVPTGHQQLHVDVDLSDIGMFSQRPRDMIYKGYNINQFESPNKFKQDKNLNSLVQIHSQDVGVYVYPYWGDTAQDTEIAVTRCDIQLSYKIEPTCIFMGSIVTDTGSNAIGKNCTSTEGQGKMSDLVTVEGSIEMIRKTFDNKVEEFQVKGNRVIDSDGVWCYQIPMNLDYVTTDEFGNLVPSDSPERGIPTRTRVRFRFTLDETPNDNTARKRCRYLVPNNPRLDKDLYPDFFETREADYEFGSNTSDESFRDLLWNQVYTVKNYIPRFQKNNKAFNRKHSAIKLTNHYGDNNPMPYNAVDIRLNAIYKLLCILAKLFIALVGFLNNILSLLAIIPCLAIAVLEALMSVCIPLGFFKFCPVKLILGWLLKPIIKVLKMITPSCIAIDSDMCGDNVTHAYTFYPGCGKFLGVNINFLGIKITCIQDITLERHNKKQVNGQDVEEQSEARFGSDELRNCMEAALAESFDAASFNFQNDWINGVLYMPMWYRKITPKKTYLFGLFKRKAKDEWCSSTRIMNKGLRKYQPCAINRTSNTRYTNSRGENRTAFYMKDGGCKNCDKETAAVGMDYGIVVKKQTMLGQEVYYYKSVEVDNDIRADRERIPTKEQDNTYSVKLAYATDIVLLGSLNEYDVHGIPQFFKSLESTTFKLPPTMLFTDNTLAITFKDKPGGKGDTEFDYQTVGEDGITITQSSVSEMTGCDWGNRNDDLCDTSKNTEDGGLFYGIGCFDIHVRPKSCINASRICEFGVSLDETKRVLKTNPGEQGSMEDDSKYDLIVPDGYISKDELYNDSQRSMFATLNGNGLRTRINELTGLVEYDFRYLYVDNFDKSLYHLMQQSQSRCTKTQKYNYYLEDFCEGYYDFRMGQNPYYYFEDRKHVFPRYENSFYFYFGLKAGKTAIEKFNSQFFSNCENATGAIDSIGIKTQGNSWCEDIQTNPTEAYVGLDLSNVEMPCEVYIESVGGEYNYSKDNINDEKVCFHNQKINPLDDKGYAGIPLQAGEKLKNGVYNLIITDTNGEIITATFSLNAAFLKSEIATDNFATPYNVLEQQFSTAENVEKEICENKEGVSEPISTASTRTIGGSIVISAPIDSNDNTPITYYKIEVKNADNAKSYFATIIKTAESTVVDARIGTIDDTINVKDSIISNDDGSYFFFGIPKGNQNYTITITQLCKNGDNYEESNNVYTETVKIVDKKPYKLFINSVIDYDVISHWKSGFKANTTNGKNGQIIADGKVSDHWWNLSADSVGQYKWVQDKNIMDYSNEIINYFKTIKQIIMGSLVVLNDAGTKFDKEMYEKYLSFFKVEDTYVDTYVKNIEELRDAVAGTIGFVERNDDPYGRIENQPIDNAPTQNTVFKSANNDEIDGLKKGIKIECDILNTIANGDLFVQCYTDGNGYIGIYPREKYQALKDGDQQIYINKTDIDDRINQPKYEAYNQGYTYTTNGQDVSYCGSNNKPDGANWIYVLDERETEVNNTYRGDIINTYKDKIGIDESLYSIAVREVNDNKVISQIGARHFELYDEAYVNKNDDEDIISKSVYNTIGKAYVCNKYSTSVCLTSDEGLAYINVEDHSEIIPVTEGKIYQTVYKNQLYIGLIEYSQLTEEQKALFSPIDYYIALGSNNAFIDADDYTEMTDADEKKLFTKAYKKKAEDEIGKIEYETNFAKIYKNDIGYNVEGDGDIVYAPPLYNVTDDETLLKTENELPQSTLYVAPSTTITIDEQTKQQIQIEVEEDNMELCYYKIDGTKKTFYTESDYEGLADKTGVNPYMYNWGYNPNGNVYVSSTGANRTHQAYATKVGSAVIPIYREIYFQYRNVKNYYKPIYGHVDGQANNTLEGKAYTEDYYFNFSSVNQSSDDILPDVLVETARTILEITKQIYNPYKNTGLLADIEQYKKTFIDNMRQTFQLYCYGDNKTINFSVQTDDYPVTYYNIYKGEELYDEEDAQEYYYTVEKGFKYTDQGYQISNITIPTIVHEKSNPNYLDTSKEITDREIETNHGEG